MSQKTKAPPNETLIAWDNPIVKLIRARRAVVTPPSPPVVPKVDVPMFRKKPTNITANDLTVGYVTGLLEYCHNEGFRLGATVTVKDPNGWWSSHIRRGTIVGVRRIVISGQEATWAPLQVLWWFDMKEYGKEHEIADMWPQDLYLIQKAPTVDEVTFLVRSQQSVDKERAKEDDNR